MTGTREIEEAAQNDGRRTGSEETDRSIRQRHAWIGVAGLTAAVAIGLGSTVWLGSKASDIKSDLEAAAELIPQIKEDIASNESDRAAAHVDELLGHTSSARVSVGDPLWTLAASFPGVGANFSAVTEIARSADDVANFGVAPLVKVFNALEWETLVPSSAGTDLEPLRKASPSVKSAAHAVRVSAQRLAGIDADALMQQVAEPLVHARKQLDTVTGVLDASANASQIAPGMLGADGPRNYLLMIQNNAESRASGGIPGALAVLNLNQGKLTLGTQSSASELGVMEPIVPVDAEQQQIFTTRLGKYMQDVNLTPDFPTAAATARAMWERKTGQSVDGVISMDPISLGYVLDATGPVEITEPELLAQNSGGLPTQLNGKNVVPTLLSDVYSKIALPQYQDVYFAGVAKEIFGALSAGGNGDAKGLIDGVSRGASEGRILLWSAAAQEQSVISKYPVSGSIAGPSVAPAQFGVYFNDGTGAKMDYYVKRTVQLVKECSTDGYEQTTVRITSTNAAPADAATSLPPYVTAGGAFGVPAGSVQTNVIAYGPVQANVETAEVDGMKTDFAAHRHANRPMGTVTVTLAPGESSTVELTFGKIVQHTEPNVVVTPTVQPVKEVILTTENASCNQ